MGIKLRCAIYTRKSSDEGLEQDFNSLHAQREAGESYVRSQAGEGWTLLSKTYDDGGFSGGSMERPGLKSLLDDVDRGLVDVVVVYKVDRLTRSLADFAKIVEKFDARGVSFVSVTQAFNTTSSMGRLTLNVLLSFAQFEREVTGERIRDKVAASKAKGMWMGGYPPLGYDLKERKLVINEDDAALVRRIFSRFIEVGSSRVLAEELDRDGLRSKCWTTSNGKVRGDRPLSKGAIVYILKNRLYVGEIVHRGQSFAGQHASLIDPVVFDQVAAKFAEQGRNWKDRPRRPSQGVLIGKIFDHLGRPFGPAVGYGKGGRIYRYYIAVALRYGPQNASDMPIQRISAPALEEHLLAEVHRLAGHKAFALPDLTQLIKRVELRPEETHIVIDLRQFASDQHPDSARQQIARRLVDGEAAFVDAGGVDWERIVFPRRMQLRGGRRFYSCQTGGSTPRINSSLVSALKRGHAVLDALNASPLNSVDRLSNAMAPPTRYQRRIARLAYLSPATQRAILSGALGEGVDLLVFIRTTMPLDWASHERWLSGLLGHRRSATTNANRVP